MNPLLSCLSVLVIVSFPSRVLGSGGDFPQVFLNHVYLVPEPQTLDAIRTHSFLRSSFSGFAERTTIAGDGSQWSGVYFYGRRTYIEFLQASAEYPVGACGAAFAIEDSGGIRAIECAMETATGPWTSELQVRSRQTEKIPWFYSVGTTWRNGSSAFECWFMEYHADYLRSWHRRDRSPADAISRQQYLADRYDPQRPLVDITGLTIALSDGPQQKLTSTLKRCGYTAKEQERRTVLTGPEVDLVLIPSSPESCGITEIRLMLQSGPQQTISAGESRLRLQGTSGAWTLDRPTR